jgi:hypothetical protein
MLEYLKTILQKVSFSRVLFERELKKGLGYLLPAELLEFKTWCYARFGHLHQAILLRHVGPLVLLPPTN